MLFVDLTKEYKKEKTQLQRAILQVLTSGSYLNGQQVEKFEKAFSRFVGSSDAIGVGSGTDAIALALKALGIGKGDEVILPTNSYPSLYGVLQSGATPLLSDVNITTCNLDRASLQEIRLSKKTKAILFVHLYGNPAGILEVAAFARKHQLFLIEDAAHAHGAKIDKKVVGTIGDIGCFSFYPTKPLGAYGDAGILTTKSKRLAKRIRFLRARGEKKRFVSEEIGVYTHLDELQAAILLIKLQTLSANNQKRRELVDYYKKRLVNLPIDFQQEIPNSLHTYMHFIIKTSQRDKLQAHLHARNIPTDIHYPIPLHLQPSLTYLGYKKGDFPLAEKLSESVLSLPLYPFLPKREIDIITHAIKEFFYQ